MILIVNIQNNIISVQVNTEVRGGNIALLREAKILEQNIDATWFISEVFRMYDKNINLVRITPQNIFVGNERESSSLLLEFDASSLIPRASLISTFKKGDRYKFGDLKVKLFYKVSSKITSKVIIIPMYLVKG